MKIFHRVLAVVLALIMTLAVLPLGVFAAEKPWIEVEADTKSPNGTDTETTIVVKVDAKQLAAILKDTGISPDLLNKIKDCISVDLDSLLGIVNQDQLFKLIPLELIPVGDIITELGEDVDLYFDLEKLIGGLDPAELMELVKTENALPILLNHYKNAEGGLVKLLTDLLAAGGATDENGDGIPDNCPVKVEELINADFWTADCFNDGVKGVSIDKYLANGYIKRDDIMAYWPKADGDFDISFLTLFGANADVKVDQFLTDLQAAGKSLLPYVQHQLMISENPVITTLVSGDPHKYLTDNGFEKVEALANEVVKNKQDWDLAADFNVDALMAFYGFDNELQFAYYYNSHKTEVESLVANNPKAYLSTATYNEIINSVLTPANLQSFPISLFYFDVLRADIEAADPTFDYDEYVDTERFVSDYQSYLIDNYKTYLTEKGLAKIYANVDMIAIARKIGIGNLIKEEGFNTVIGWLEFDEVLKGIEASGKSIANYVYIDRVIKTIGIDTVWSILVSSGTSLDQVVYMDKAITAIGMPALLAELTMPEMVALYQLDVVKAAVSNILTTVMAQLPYIIDEITFNGKAFAKEDPNSLSGKLAIDPAILLKELVKAIPTLDELANLTDDTLFSADFGLTYKPMGAGEKSVTKNFSVSFELVGAADEVSAAAAKLQELLNKYVEFSISDDLAVKLDIKVPARVTALYGKVLASDKLNDTLRQKLLLLPNLDGKDAVAMLDSLTLAEIVEVLEKTSPTALYDKIMQVKYVELALDKIAAVTGKDLSGIELEDVLAKLDDAIDKAGSVGLVQKLYAVIESKTGYDVTTVLEIEDLDAIYESAVEKAKNSTAAFNKVKNYLNTIVDKIDTIAPALLNTSIGDLYETNGAFNISGGKKIDVNARALLERVLGKLPESISAKIPQQALDIVLDMVPERINISPSVDFTVHFADLYRVTYHDIGGEILLDAFLPVGTKLSIYTDYTAPADIEVEGWRLTDGTVVTEVTGDMDVYPNVVAGTFKVTVLDDAGNVLMVLDKKAGEKLTAEEIASITYTKAAEAGYERIYRYDLKWYLQGDESTTINLATFMVGGEVTICARFDKVYLFDGAEDLTATDDGYKLDNVEFGDGKTQVTVPDAVVEYAKEGDVGLTINGKDNAGNDIKINIDAATLDQLIGLGDTVVFEYEKNTEFEVSYYNEKNSDQYTFDFLCGDDANNLKSYSELLGENKNFAGKVTFELPFTSIEQTEKQGTHVYYTNEEDHSRTLIESTVTDTHVIFVAPHFSDFVIANEYALDYTFAHKDTGDTTALSGTLGIADDRHFFPKNAVLTMAPVINNGDYIASAITWIDANGSHSATQSGSKWTMTMPANAVTLTVEAEYNVYVTVTFEYAKNATQTATRTIRFLSGTSLDAALTQEDRDWLAAVMQEYPEATDKYLYEFTFYWYEKGDADQKKVEIADYTSVTENTTIVAKFEKSYYFDATQCTLPTGATIEVEIDGTTYVTEIVYSGELGKTTVALPAKVAELAAELNGATWVIRVTDPTKNESYDLLTVNNDMLKRLYENGNTYAAFSYEKLDTYTLADLYNKDNSCAYELSLVAGANASSAASVDLIKGSVAVKLPFADGIGNSATSQVRVNFITAGDERELVADAAFTAGYVTFKPAHFSKYVVANEYLVTYKFIYNEQAAAGGTVTGLDAKGEYYPTGTKVTITPEAADYYVGVVYYVKDGNKVTLDKSANTWSFTITKDNAASTELIIDLRTTTYHIYYYQLQADNTYALVHTTVYGKGDNLATVVKELEAIKAQYDAMISRPYGSYVWTGYDASMLGKADMYVYQTLKLNDYTVNFKDESGNVVGSVTINYNSNKAELVLPTVPAKVGHTAVWEGWDALNVKAAIDTMIAENKTSMDLTVAYTKGSYVIKHDGNVIVNPYAEYGSSVLVEIIQRDHFTATITVLSENGEKIDVENELFVMPACGVTISVSYKADEFGYTVNGVASNEKVVFGDTVSFQITLKKGERVAEISDFCKLIGIDVKADGTTVLTYVFTVTEDEMAVEYKLATIAFDLIHIFNGASVNGSVDPTVEEKGVLFAGWSDTVADAFVFAKYDVEHTSSLLWLWILLAVVLLIAIIALLYVLYIKEILKANFITRFVAWIVGGFFAVCMFLASVFLYFVSLGGKSEADYYLQTEADFEKTMEQIEGEETAEETTEEATEEDKNA